MDNQPPAPVRHSLTYGVFRASHLAQCIRGRAHPQVLPRTADLKSPDSAADRLQNSLKQLTAEGNVSKGTAAGLAPKIEVPPERRFVGLDAYRHAIDCGVDVVLLTTPPGFRPVQFEYAVQEGKHVFMEKPVAVDAPGIRRVLAAAAKAKRKGLKVGVGLHRRHDRVYQETLDLSPSGYTWGATPSILPDANGVYPVAMPGVVKAV